MPSLGIPLPPPPVTKSNEANVVPSDKARVLKSESESKLIALDSFNPLIELSYSKFTLEPAKLFVFSLI